MSTITIETWSPGPREVTLEIHGLDVKPYLTENVHVRSVDPDLQEQAYAVQTWAVEHGFQPETLHFEHALGEGYYEFTLDAKL